MTAEGTHRVGDGEEQLATEGRYLEGNEGGVRFVEGRQLLGCCFAQVFLKHQTQGPCLLYILCVYAC